MRIDYPSLGAVDDLCLDGSIGDGQFCFGERGLGGVEAFAKGSKGGRCNAKAGRHGGAVVVVVV